jgi:hypothetical protein
MRGRLFCGLCFGESVMQNKGLAEILKLVSIFVLVAVALGFFASIGIWAAVSFLRLFGIETL